MILLTAFDGEKNSSRIFIESLNVKNSVKLVLDNDFDIRENQIISALVNYKPDIVICFGQKPNSNRLYIETTARRFNQLLKSDWSLKELEIALKANEVPYKISENAGNYLCNHVYFSGLNFKKTHNLSTKLLFIHTPAMNKFLFFDKAVKSIDMFLNNSIC